MRAFRLEPLAHKESAAGSFQQLYKMLRFHSINACLIFFSALFPHPPFPARLLPARPPLPRASAPSSFLLIVSKYFTKMGLKVF